MTRAKTDWTAARRQAVKELRMLADLVEWDLISEATCGLTLSRGWESTIRVSGQACAVVRRAPLDPAPEIVLTGAPQEIDTLGNAQLGDGWGAYWRKFHERAAVAACAGLPEQALEDLRYLQLHPDVQRAGDLRPPDVEMLRGPGPRVSVAVCGKHGQQPYMRVSDGYTACVPCLLAWYRSGGANR